MRRVITGAALSMLLVGGVLLIAYGHPMLGAALLGVYVSAARA